MQDDEDRDDEVGVLDDPAYLADCREYEREIVLAVCGSTTARSNPDAVSVGGLNVAWGKRMSRLKTWGGQQNLGDMIRERAECMLSWAGKKIPKKRKKKDEESTDSAESPAADTELPTTDGEVTWKTISAIQYQSSLTGVSGIIPGHARVNGIDMGFSPNGLKIPLNPWLEILVMVGVEFSPIAIIPNDHHTHGHFAVYSNGLWFPFYRRVRIDPYYYAWDYSDDRGLLPHQFAKMIDPNFSPGPFDDLQIPRHLLDNPDILWNEIERLKRIASRTNQEALA